MSKSYPETAAAIIRQLEERLDRGQFSLGRDLPTLKKQSGLPANVPLLGDIHQLLGRVEATMQSNFSGAIEHFEAAIQHYETAGQMDKLAQATMRCGIAYGFSGNVPQSIDHIEKAAELAEASGDMTTLTHCLCNLAASYEALENYTKSRRYYEQAAEIMIYAPVNRRRGNMMLQIDLGLANANYKMGNIDTARDLARKAYVLAKDTYQIPLYVIRSADLLASLDISHPQAEGVNPRAYLDEALLLIDQHNLSLEKPSVLETESAWLEQQGNLSAARAKREAALELFEATGQKTFAARLREKMKQRGELA